MWHSPVACCSSQKFGLTHYGQSSLLINKDTMVVKYSPASWSNIIELHDPATCQENVNYVSTSPKISPEFGLSCMMTIMIMVVVKKIEPPSCFFATLSHRRWHMSLSFFQQIQADDLPGNFWFPNLGLLTRYLSPESHEDLDTREPLEIWFEMGIYTRFWLVLHGQLNSVVKGIYLTFLREKA